MRGARSGNTIMMAPGYEQGFGFLRNSAIDQHVITRHRENDLNAVIAKHPKLLGIGIDQSTAIVVQGNRLDVIGQSEVLIHTLKPGPDGKQYFVLKNGDRFDLKTRKELSTKSDTE